MNRRESLRFIGVGSITTGILWESCKPDAQSKAPETSATSGSVEIPEAGREAFEIERDKKLVGEQFFNEHEMATITVLADWIIPKDEKSGSATEAGVPDFIEFIVKDIPAHQLPMRGGLRWLDMECYSRHEKAFVDAGREQQQALLDDIAYPKKVKPGMEQGVAFFNRMRDLTATGFFTSEIGLADLEYKGNMANDWKGVPKDVLAAHGFTMDG